MKHAIIKSTFLSVLVIVFCGLFFFDYLWMAGNDFLHGDAQPVSFSAKAVPVDVVPVVPKKRVRELKDIPQSGDFGYIEYAPEPFDPRQSRIPLPRGPR